MKIFLFISFLMFTEISSAIFIGIAEDCRRRQEVPEIFTTSEHQSLANQLYWWLHGAAVMAEGARASGENEACFEYDLERLRSSNPYPAFMNYAQQGCVPAISQVIGRMTQTINYERGQRSQQGFCTYLRERMSHYNERASVNFQNYILSENPRPAIQNPEGAETPQSGLVSQ